MDDKKLNPVGWFEIPATDLDRAENFYKKVFGFEMARQPKDEDGLEMSWFPMFESGMGAAGALYSGLMAKPSHDGTTVYFTAPNGDIDAALAKIESLDGKTLVPKTSIGEHGFIAQFEDCEGNRVAIHSMTG